MRMNNRGIAPLIIIVIMISVVAGAIIGFGGTGGLGSDDGYFQAPYTATISCIQSGQSKTSQFELKNRETDETFKIPGEWVSDKLPENTNEWSISIQAPKSSLLELDPEVWIIECSQRKLDDATCFVNRRDISAGGELVTQTVSSTQHVFVSYNKLGFTKRIFSNDATVKFTYKPFILQREDRLRGGLQEVSQDGCEVPYLDPAWTNRLLSGNDGAPTPERQLNPGEYFNYISGTVTRANAGNSQDGGYCIYQNGQARIFPIDEWETPSKTYDVVNTNAQGVKVECCNGDNLPDKTCEDGKWVSTVNAQCSIINPCGGSDWRRDLQVDKQIIKYGCDDGKCVPKTEKVECSEDDDCSTNQRCSTATWKCVDAGVGGEGAEREIVTRDAFPWWGWALILMAILGIGIAVFPAVRGGLEGFRASAKGIPLLGRFVP